MQWMIEYWEYDNGKWIDRGAIVSDKASIVAAYFDKDLYPHALRRLSCGTILAMVTQEVRRGSQVSPMLHLPTVRARVLECAAT